MRKLTLKERYTPGIFTISDGFSGAVHEVVAGNHHDAIHKIKESFRVDGISLQGRGRGFKAVSWRPIGKNETETNEVLSIDEIERMVLLYACGPLQRKLIDDRLISLGWMNCMTPGEPYTVYPGPKVSSDFYDKNGSIRKNLLPENFNN